MPIYAERVGDTELDTWLELRDNGMTAVKAAARVKELYGLPHTVGSLVRILSDLRRLRVNEEDLPHVHIPPELQVPYEDCIVACDMHLPYLHTGAFGAMIADARAADIKTLVLNGDVFDLDWCSTYVGVSTPGNLHEVDEHVAAVREVLERLPKVFRTIYVVRGNHDARMLKAVSKRLGMDHVFRIFTTSADGTFYDRFTVTERYYMVMRGSPEGDWRFTHQREYLRIRGRTSQRIAARYQANVVCAHTHHASLTVSDDSNQWYCVDGGCLLDPAKIEYKQLRDSTHPSFVVAYTILSRGVPHLRIFRT